VKILAPVLIFFVLITGHAQAQQPEVHGLWVLKTPFLLDLPARGVALRNFCRTHHINEIYLSYTSQNGGAAEQQEIEKLIALLHRDHIRVEALLHSKDADEPGKNRDKLLGHVNEVLAYNQHHSHQQFDGFHLDIRPQDRLEYQGNGKLGYLPGLIDAYWAVRNAADMKQMTVNADIPVAVLKADANQRRALFTSLPRFTLMLENVPAGQLSQTAGQSLQAAYQGLKGSDLAGIVVGLRSSDFAEQLPPALATGTDPVSSNTHYLGWAWHAYSVEMSSGNHDVR
jgi:hypothetical protein